MSADVVELTRALVRAQTVNPPGQEQTAATLVGQRLEAAGLGVYYYEHAPGRSSLVARLPGRGERPALCLAGHLDTVPLGSVAWTHDPHGGELDGELLFGRGASDMKGGVAAIVIAAERLARLPSGRAGLELVLAAGEETGCEGSLALASTPDALSNVGAVLVAEPTANEVCVAHKGVLWLEAHTSGRAAHASAPHLGQNAIYPLARAAIDIEHHRFAAEPHELLGFPTISVTTIAGGQNINSVPDHATAGIDVRLVPGQRPEQILNELQALLGPEVNLKVLTTLPGVATDPSDPWVQDVLSVMQPLTAQRAPTRGVPFFTDASALTPAYGNPPTVICGPGEPRQAHQRDEHCVISRLHEAAEGFFEVARRWCGL